MVTGRAADRLQRERIFHGASSSQLYVSKADGTVRRVLTHACGECAFSNDDPSWQPLPG